MSGSPRIVGLVVLAVAAAGVVAVATRGLRGKRQVAIETAHEIEAQLADLDPVTRAGVEVRLARDAAHSISDRVEG